MKLILESQNLDDYLQEIPNLIEFKSGLVKDLINEIKNKYNTKLEQAHFTFNFVRDEIIHSFDRQDIRGVYISAEDVLKHKEGICYSKSHLLAALLRGQDIPCGFCYQRVLKKTNDPNSGLALHGLNAVYLDHVGWFRVDPRGNKEGIDSHFNYLEEKLAYPIRAEYDEVDYPQVLTVEVAT